MILKSEKLTSRSSSATLVSDSTLSVPSAGLSAPFARVGHRRVQDGVLLVDPARDLRLVDDERGAARRRIGARPALVGSAGPRAAAEGFAAVGFVAGACALTSGAIGEARKLMTVSTMTRALTRE